MPTIGSQVVPARLVELQRLIRQFDAADLVALDESLGGWVSRPLIRETVAGVALSIAGSVYLCMLNFELAGLMLIERGQLAARIRALAVVPDLRRRGLARTMLEAAEALARQAGLRWLWMTVPSDNLPATRCALVCGYRRYRPQFMRRQLPQALPVHVERARVERIGGQEAEQQLHRWLGVAARQGDPWCGDLAQADLFAWNTAKLSGGALYLLISAPDEVGLAHVREELSRRVVTLWLDRALWNTPRELHVLKAALDTLVDVPPVLDVEFGSSGHLRTSAPSYKALGFRPVLHDRVVMAKKLK
jgi:GNAT superfamily N-acetyltransferase